MSTAIELNASARTPGGKGAAKNIRREGRIPAVIYGNKQKPEAVVLEYMPTLKQYQSGSFLSTVYNLNVDGKSTRVLPRDIQLDPVRDFIMHVDFLRLSKDARIDVEVAVHFINEEACRGLERGGSLNVVRHVVELSCPSDAIPEFLEADLTGLDIGDAIHISDIKLPDGIVPTIDDRDFTIATIVGMQAEEVEEEPTEEGAEGEDADAEEKEDDK